MLNSAWRPTPYWSTSYGLAPTGFGQMLGCNNEDDHGDDDYDDYNYDDDGDDHDDDEEKD